MTNFNSIINNKIFSNMFQDIEFLNGFLHICFNVITKVYIVMESQYTSPTRWVEFL